MRLAVSLAAAAVAAALPLAPASAVPDCQGPVTLGPCVVRDSDGSYTCTLGYAEVEADLFGFTDVAWHGCIVPWAP